MSDRLLAEGLLTPAMLDQLRSEWGDKSKNESSTDAPRQTNSTQSKFLTDNKEPYEKKKTSKQTKKQKKAQRRNRKN